MGVHECGVGAADSDDAEGVEVLPSGSKDMSVMPGKAWEDMYPLRLCVSVVVHVGSCSAGETCALTVYNVYTRVLRLVH